ncbi:uncharacterized protein LOC125804780 [Astyanax mexicanus]|uniref:uncharacterized protein LOC125804780 n=1 Tax=Astyanax mexicanus TaxID=7994 RepID=UPI0020CAC9D2|nr:uncharacterized protein LOC125804780 [Astyanax mexicanus]
MPPKKVNNISEEEMEEIRKSLNYMSEELSKVVKQQAMLLDLMGEVKQLKSLVKEKDKTIELLERRIDDLEQYTRMEDLIISGLETTHKTYASTTAGRRNGEDAPTEELQTLEKQVIQFFESKNMYIDSKNITACHTLPRKDRETKPAIIVRFVNRKHKIELLRQAKKLKGTRVYLNEHLTKKNADIARQPRFLKKQQKIQSTWTRNCKVMIRLNGTPEESKVLLKQL